MLITQSRTFLFLEAVVKLVRTPACHTGERGEEPRIIIKKSESLQRHKKSTFWQKIRACSPTNPYNSMRCVLISVAGRTGLEPATSCVTGRRSNQLNYHPKLKP